VAKVRPKHQRDLHGAHSGGLIDAENGLVSRRIFIEPEIYIEEVRFARDSPLEEDGFEPSVPPVKETAMERGIRGQPSSSRETRA